MNKPYVDNPKYFIKKKSWFLVAWWIGYKWKELHWDYEYVRNREEWEKLLNDLKKSEWKNNVWDAECISEKKLIGYGAIDVLSVWMKN